MFQNCGSDLKRKKKFENIMFYIFKMMVTMCKACHWYIDTWNGPMEWNKERT